MTKTFEGKKMFPIPLPAIVVAEWSPLDDRENPTQVHLVIDLEDAEFLMAMRFKSARELDRLIHSLITTRRNVFPDAPKICEE